MTFQQDRNIWAAKSRSSGGEWSRVMNTRMQHMVRSRQGTLRLVFRCVSQFVFAPVIGLCLFSWLFCTSLHAVEPVTSRIDFRRDIRPILADKCFACHGPDESRREADLRLDDATSAYADRGSASAIVPGQPEESLVIQRALAEAPEERMPPPDSGKELSADERELLRIWIAQGGEFAGHWAFEPRICLPIPEVTNTNWPRGPIDQWLLAGLESRQLQPSPEADRGTLFRRLHFDLSGLPPTSEQITSFLADERPDAFEQAVDRLLASPHFGERMAIYWLDLVRYADTVGYHGDQEHHISPYRDYVIEAFNRNLPFDQFAREQLAGDLLPDSGIQQKVATGYNRVLQTSHEGGVQMKEYLAKYSADRVRNFGEVWLGITLGCAECHHHKFDPISQDAFYELAAFFADIDDYQSFRATDTNPTRREPELVVSQTQRTLVTVSTDPREIRVLARGDWMDETGRVVEPRTPDFLPALPESATRLTRLDLANWLTAESHPLTSRVLANRLWYLLFGNGLTPSLDDMGSQGEPPTYPELLDYLARELMTGSWDVKRLVRQIVTSSAYRQSSLESENAFQRDPENRFFARQSRFRLPAELIRDQALQAGGLLVHGLGGPSARPYQPAGYYAALNFPKRTYLSDTNGSQYRRGVYMHWQRQFLHPMLKAFDAPSREECTSRRPSSNTPLAALVLLNDPTFLEAARALAERTLREAGPTPEERIDWAWTTVLSRPAEANEREVLLEFWRANRTTFQDQPENAALLLKVGLSVPPPHLDKVELAAWTQVMRAILNLHETITRN
jgi:hypothetical protein